MTTRMILILALASLLAAQDSGTPPIAPKDEPQPQDPAAKTRAAARLGRLHREGQIETLKNVMQVPVDRIPEITETNKADLIKKCSALPDAGQVTLTDMVNLYKVAGPKGIHYLYDTKRLSEAHAAKFKELRDTLNERILVELGGQFGKIGVNNFGSGGNCRSDHDQTLFTDPEHTPKEVIDAYNHIFKRELGGNYDPSIIELSNFDGSETFPDWRIVKSVGIFGASLKTKFASIPGNPEAYPLIGAFREIVDISSFDAPKTYTEYRKDPKTGEVVKEQVDARERIYKGLRPEQRRAHGAGAAIANWYFHNHHGGGKDPIEQAKYFLRNVGYGGFLVTNKSTEAPEFKVQAYEKLKETEGNTLEEVQREYIKGIFAEEPARVEEFRQALNVAVKIRALKHSAKDPETGLLKPEILKEWAERIQKTEGKTPDEALHAAQERYNSTKMEMMTRVMVKSFPHLVQNWLEPPKDMEHVRRKIRLHCQVNKILPGKLDAETLRTTLQMTNYHELRNLMRMVGADHPELVKKLIDACPPEHRKHVEAIHRSVEAERAMRNPPPAAPLTHFQEAKKKALDLLHDLKLDALWAKWQVEKFYNDPRNSSKEIAKRMWEDMVDEVGEKLGAKAKVEIDNLGRVKVTKEYSAKDFFLNNMNMANGLAAVHGLEAYLKAERDNPGDGTRAFAECVAFELVQQLPYIGGIFDIKAALNGDVSGVLMNLGGRIFPQIMKRYLAITLLVDAAIVSAKVFGWMTFDMIAQDNADLLYMGILPAKQAGVAIPGNKEKEALLPGLVQLLDVTADAKKIAGFTEEEEKKLDEDLKERLEKKQFSEKQLPIEKQRRIVWIHFQPIFEDYLTKLGVVPGNYEKKENYEKARAAVLTALLYGGDAEGKTLESVPKITIRKFLMGQLFKDPTDVDVYAGVFAKLPHDIADRLTQRLFKDYENGITAHAHYLSQKSAEEAKQSREAVNEGMGPIYAMNDALKAAADQGEEVKVGMLAGRMWEDYLVPPMEPGIRLVGYRVKEKDEKTGEEREDVQVRVCVYGSVLDHPLPWNVKIVVTDSKKAKSEAGVPQATLKTEQVEGETKLVFERPSAATEVKTDVPTGAVTCGASVMDADGKPMAMGSFACGVFGGVVKVELTSVDKDRQKQIFLSLIKPPENKGLVYHEVSFYRAANPDGPYFVLAAGQSVTAKVVDDYPFFFSGQRTWYYACSICRKEGLHAKEGPLSAPTPLSLDLQVANPNLVELTPKMGAQGYVEMKFAHPAEPQVLELDVYKSFSSGGPFLNITSTGYPLDDKPAFASDGSCPAGATIYYKFVNRRYPGYCIGVLWSEAVAAQAKIPGATTDNFSQQAWTMKKADYSPWGIPLQAGQSVEFKAEGTGQFVFDEIKDDNKVLAKTGPHGPEGMPKTDVEKLRDASIGIADRWRAKELAKDTKPEHAKWTQDHYKEWTDSVRKQYDGLLDGLFSKEHKPGAALGVFMARERKGEELTIVPLTGSFKAPVIGNLMFVINTSEKCWPNFKQEYKYKLEYRFGQDSKGIDIPAPQVEAVQLGGRHGLFEIKHNLKEYKAPPGLKSYEFSPSLFASELPDAPMVKFDVSYHPAFSLQSRMGLGNQIFPPGQELYFRVGSGNTIVSGPSIVKTPKSFTCRVYELPWTSKDAVAKSDGYTTTMYKGNDPDAVIAVREGQTITLSVEGGEWNLFTVQGGPSCGGEGLSADQLKTWVDSVRDKVNNAEMVKLLESGELGRFPKMRMGALVAQFHTHRSGAMDMTVVGKGSVTLKAPCDGVLRLRPNSLRYDVESELKRGGAAERTDRGPGLSVKVTLE